MSKSKLVDRIGQFTTIPNAVIELWPKIGIDAMALFLYLRYRTNSQTETAFPSFDTISADTGMTRKRIAQAARKLESAGLVTRKRRFGASTLYILKMPDTFAISNDAGLMEAPISNDAGLSLVTGVHTNQIDINQNISSDKKKSDETSGLFPIAEAIANVCRMDLNKNRGMLFAEAKRLKESPSEIIKRYSPGGWWYLSDWRGKKGQSPRPAQIRETWGAWLNDNQPSEKVLEFTA